MLKLQWHPPLGGPAKLLPLKGCLLAGLACFCLVPAGCAKQGARKLTGTVTYDGAPLAQGVIRFESLPAPSGRVEGGRIHDGKFEIVPKWPLDSGSYRVVITSPKGPDVPKGSYAPGERPEGIETIPGRYNLETQLVVEVRPGSQSEFTFALEP